MKYIVAMLLICIGVGTAVVLYLTKPRAKKARPRRPAALVQVVELRPASEPVVIEAQGTVIAARQLTLQAEVDGRIIYQDPNLVLGGTITAGRKLLQIDPEDYRLAVRERQADLEDARFEAEMEVGRRVIAQREWKLLENEIATTEAGRRLALRQPHEKRAAARLQAAESRLAQAKLDEKRCALSCPFNALVLEESVEVGQLVGPQTKLATLVGTDQFWVQVSVPLSKLLRVSFPRGGRGGTAARVLLDTANGSPVVREGRVLRLLGDLDPSGAMARVLVAIDNPLDLPIESNGSGGSDGGEATDSPMRMGPRCILLGCYVKVEIDAGREEGVYVVPRAALREGDRLWLVDAGGKLVFREADVLWRRLNEVLVRCDLAAGERLVVSRLSAPLPGMKVRLQEPRAPATAPASGPVDVPATQPAEDR